MLPIVEPNAIYAAWGCAMMLACGLFANSATLVSLAAGGFLGLSAALALTMPIGVQLRRQRLEFAWWLGHAEPAHGGAGAVAGMPFEVRCYIRNRDRRALRFTKLMPVVPVGVELLLGRDAELFVPARARSEFAFRLSAVAAGRVVLQGLAVAVPGPLGLFSSPLYFPSPLTIKVLPRGTQQASSSARPTAGEAVERSGLAPLRRRGAGMELHEIREFRPGDPFKAIAWKASARAGKLLVREVEHEVQDTLQIVLDVGSAMRGGRPGERKLDHCIELAALLAKRALERGDRVGLCTVDGRPLTHVAVAEGARHMLRIYDALLKTTEVVDADLTQVDDAGVSALVAQYLRQQEGLELGADGSADRAALIAHVERALQAEPDHDPVVAAGREQTLLRRFCRARGIALPYRGETRSRERTEALAAALRDAAGTTRMPRTLLLVSDFEGIGELETLIVTLRLLKRRGHNLVCVIPDAESFALAPQNELERDLQRVYALQERRRAQQLEEAFGKIGVALISFDARLGTAAVARRTDALRHVA